MYIRIHIEYEIAVEFYTWTFWCRTEFHKVEMHSHINRSSSSIMRGFTKCNLEWVFKLNRIWISNGAIAGKANIICILSCPSYRSSGNGIFF